MTKSEMLDHIAELSEDNMRLRNWLKRISELSIDDLSEEEKRDGYIVLFANAKAYAKCALNGYSCKL